MQWIWLSAPPPPELWDTVGSGDPHTVYDLWQCSDPSDNDGMFGSDPSPSTCPSPRLYQPLEYSLDDHHRGANNVPFGPSTDPSPVPSTSHDTARIVVLPTIQPATPSKHGDDFNNVEPHHPSSPRFVPSYHRPASSYEQRHGADQLPPRLRTAYIEVKPEERIHGREYQTAHEDMAPTSANLNMGLSPEETTFGLSYERLGPLRPCLVLPKPAMHPTCVGSYFKSTPRSPSPRRRRAPRVHHPPHVNPQCAYSSLHCAVQEDVTHARARIARTSSVIECQCHVLGRTDLSRPSRAESEEGPYTCSFSSPSARGSRSPDRSLFLRGERRLSEWPPTHRGGPTASASQTRTSSSGSAPGLGLCWGGHSGCQCMSSEQLRRVALKPTGMDLCTLPDPGRDAGADGIDASGVDGSLGEAGE